MYLAKFLDNSAKPYKLLCRNKAKAISQERILAFRATEDNDRFMKNR